MLWAALIALLVPWPLIYFTWLSVYWIYLIQLAVFAAAAALLLPRRVRYMAGAGLGQEVARAPARGRAVPRPEPAHDRGADGRADLRLRRRALCRNPGRLGHRCARSQGRRGRRSSTISSRQIGAGRAADGFVAAVTAVGKHLAQHFPPGTADRNELPDHLIILA